MQVAKWGNSLAVRLPKRLVDELGLKPGDEIEITFHESRRLTVEKRDKATEFLEAMKAFNWRAPEGYRFDRDEANER